MYKSHYAPADTTAVAFPENNVDDMLKPADGYEYLLRLNCGGDEYTDHFGNVWRQDSPEYSHSWGEDFNIYWAQASQTHITDDIRGTGDDELFQFMRFGRQRLWYDFAVEPGTYRIELYFAEPWHGKGGGESDDCSGLRLFDVAVNGDTLIHNLDLWAQARYAWAFKKVVTAKAENGHLRISFPRVAAGQAVISAIAVAERSSAVRGGKIGDFAVRGGKAELCSNTPCGRQAGKADYWHSLDTDTIAKLPRETLPSGGDKVATFEAQKQKGGATAFHITTGIGKEYALRFKYKNTTGKNIETRMTITDARGIKVVDKPVAFPPTPAKFKTLSTTTQSQINAGKYTLRIIGRGEDLEFKAVEVQ